MAHELSLDQLRDELRQFKSRIAGADDYSRCQELEASEPQNATPLEGQEDQQVDYYLERIQVNACSENRFTYADTSNNTSECLPERTPGLIDQLVETTMSAEQREETPAPLRLDDARLRETHQRATHLLNSVRLYLVDNQVDKTERQELLVQYLDSVLLPMRDLIIVKRSYLDAQEYDGRYFYESLLPDFPAALVSERETVEINGVEQRIVDRVTMGPNPSSDPFYLQLVSKGLGRASLEFRELEILSRDLISLLKAPTSENYLRALKWMTLQMMLSQLQLYKAVTGDYSPVQLPAMCRRHTNGELPEQIQVSVSPEVGEEYLEGLLFSHGLLFDSSDYQAMEYFVENTDRDPTRDGYSGLMGFEKYKTAKVGLEGNQRGPNRATLDDIEHFETLMQMRIGRAMEPYEGEVRPPRSEQDRTPRRAYFAGHEEFNKLLGKPSAYQIFEIETASGRKYTLDPERQNLSTFLAEAMVRKGVLSFEELLSRDLKERLQSTEVLHPFPPLHAPHLWRQWGLGLLSDVVTRHADVERTHPVARAVERVCYIVPQREKERFCHSERQFPVKKLAETLAPFSGESSYLPLRRLNEADIERIYPYLAALWDILRSSGDDLLPEAKTNEYDFLIDQMGANSPWARLRLGYLVYQEELINARNSHPRQNDNQTMCLYTQVNQRLQRLNQGARELGIHRPLSLFYADGLVSSGEREYVFSSTLDEVHEGNAQLFTEKLQGREAYDYLDQLSYKTFLSEEQVDEMLATMPGLDRRAQEELRAVLADENSKLRMDLYQIYRTRGNVEAQTQALDRLIREHGIYDSLRVKMAFLMLDSELKAPLMKLVIRKAAEQRKHKLEDQLEEFCGFEGRDFESYKAMFHATSRAQNKINELAGLPQVPEQVLERIEGMSDAEWTNMWLGIGAGVLGVGAVLIGGACTLVTGGLCAPISAAMIAAGASAISMNMVLIGREYEMKRDADLLESKVQLMEDLGFANGESAYQVSRSWFWTVLEGVFMIPLIGVTARSVTVGGKMFYVSTQHALRGSSRETFREVSRQTLAEADVRMARYKLGMDNIGNSMTVQSLVRGGQAGREASTELATFLVREGVPQEIVHRAFQDMERVRHLFATGKITMDVMVRQMTRILDPLTTQLRGSATLLQRTFGQVAVRESKEVIDRRASEVIAQYFGHNPHGLLKLVQTYTGKRLATATARMAMTEQRTGVFNRIPLVRNLVSWFRRIRSEELVKNADKLRRLETDLVRLTRDGGDLQFFIHQNLDTLTDVFMNIPLRKRELPYFFLVLGGPSLGGRLSGARVPGLGALTDGFLLRQFVNARSRLVYESFKTQARETLQLQAIVASESTFTAYKAFQFSVSEAIETLPEAEARALSLKLLELEEEIAGTVFQNLQSRQIAGRRFRLQDGRGMHELSSTEVRRILFQANTLEEEAIAEVLWTAVPTERILGLESLGSVAHQAVEELSNYRTVDQFQNYLSALKILVLKRDPAVVQYF